MATSPTSDGGAPRSGFQRALTALGVAYLVAPSPKATEKIGHRFGTVQKRLVTLSAFERMISCSPAKHLVDHAMERLNRTVCCTTGSTPDDAPDNSQNDDRDAKRPCPEPSMLDLHFSLHFGRRRCTDHQIDFLGRSWPIGPASLSSVSVIYHPDRQFRIVTFETNLLEYNWPDIFVGYPLRPRLNLNAYHVSL